MEIAELLAIVILAAGKGTRMNSDLPKVLHPLGGVPLIEHVLRASRPLKPARTVVIVGHRREEVLDQLRDSGVEFAVQEPQLGTGHAVQQAGPVLNGFRGSVIVLSGDVPMLRAKTLQKLLEAHQTAGAAATVLSTQAPNPTAYGRIIRDGEGRFLRIVEEREATAEEKTIHEINSGIYCFDSEELFSALRDVRADNSKGEYYLTDVIGLLRRQGLPVQAFDFADFNEVQGINTVVELASAERVMTSARAESST
jgi:UDP-N-acetylglucosamine diphosphorylase/glucosamine-1-phosphate N-acetyltransferase